MSASPIVSPAPVTTNSSKHLVLGGLCVAFGIYVLYNRIYENSFSKVEEDKEISGKKKALVYNGKYVESYDPTSADCSTASQGAGTSTAGTIDIKRDRPVNGKEVPVTSQYMSVSMQKNIK
uniref:Uncharacterized protein n=1 Tax=Parastrongyloides trichosuri TaxID=131310 RepID=A0A0N5A6G9_PARTI